MSETTTTIAVVDDLGGMSAYVDQVRAYAERLPFPTRRVAHVVPPPPTVALALGPTAPARSFALVPPSTPDVVWVEGHTRRTDDGLVHVNRHRRRIRR